MTPAPDRQAWLLGFGIDAPETGRTGDVHVLHVIGWAVGRDAQARTLEILEQERIVRVAPIRGRRRDVAAAFGIAPETECAFEALVTLPGLRLRTTLTLRIELEDGSRVDAGTIALDREPLRSGYEPRLAPLMVTTLGRSGSTWLMQILAAHPEVVVFRRFPYESAPAKYWTHALRLASESANPVQSADVEDFHASLWWIGANPFHDERLYAQPPLGTWFAGRHVEQLAAFAQRTIDDWYGTLARVQDQPRATYFAEKHMWPGYLPVLTWELYPRAKEIFLVRDFRDMTRSIMAFDEKRGYPGFGRPEGASDEEYLRGELRQMVDSLRRSWAERRDRACLVRYEDLARRPAETVTSMLEYLEVDSAPGAVESVLAHGAEQILSLPGSSHEPTEVAVHRTAGGLDESIDRWRREVDESFASAADEVFGEALAEFGYE